MSCGQAIAMLITVAATSGGSVDIGTEANFPPYTMRASTGAVVGFDRDVGDEVCRRARLTCAWHTDTFDRLLPGVMDGTYDIAISGMAATTGRERVVDMTEPYWEATGTDDFIGRPGAPSPDRALIGVQSGTIHADHLAATGRRFVTFATSDEVVAALVARRVELAYSGWNVDILDELAAEQGIEVLYEESLDSDGLSMAVCEGNAALLGQLNMAIATMWEDGTIDALAKKWLYQ